jgi:bifunctional DNase/RNase
MHTREVAYYMIPVKITNVVMLDKQFVIFLQAEGDERVLPIFVAEQQAQSLFMYINHVETHRLLTHDLIKNMMKALGVTITHAEISDVKDNMFYARLYAESNGKTCGFDARPSDALCLALRFNAAIFVEEHVMEKAGMIFSNEEEFFEMLVSEKTESVLYESETELSVLDVLNSRLGIAIKEERYEDAGYLRDEIQRTAKFN